MTLAPCGPPHWKSWRGHPPWWPEGEAWPPVGPPGTQAWHRMRRHFLRRAVVFLAAVLTLTIGLSALLLWGAASLLGIARVPPGWVTLGQAAVAAIIGLGAALLAGRAFRRMAVPIGDLMAALGRVADGDNATRVTERGPQEMRTLTRAFNAMAERLQRQEEQRRTLLTDVSHELRTPLSVLQGNLEGMLDGVYPRDDAHLSLILEETQVLARLAEDLRTLTLAETLGLILAKTTTDLAEIAQEAIASFQAQADAAGVTLRHLAEPGLPPADVDPERVRQVLNNLLTNALRYTPTGGTVRVRCSRGEAEDIVLSVEDTGAGIPAEELPQIFDRFYKSKDSRGTGLGLAIAKSLVRAHGGEISAHSAPGEGTTIRCTLPLHSVS
ncbi:MAG: HAMP domain-containing histidine kinase [Bacillati bacterium ANGP1]|uniref:histidine kinase n=1 Tax=Candidatus Segetimicrobium genomatis TaxID=2569760 RepID=A0A537LI90_9BACT|nr:MAG: HAMP domain-containing histidine kinase [Terrabacteria group bacterium ANGP1]